LLQDKKETLNLHSSSIKMKSARRRVNAVLRRLAAKHGFAAKARAACCSNCGLRDVKESFPNNDMQNYVFYHTQNNDISFNRHGEMIDNLWLSWRGDVATIMSEFWRDGFAVEWNGDLGECFCIKQQ
jgi:hypothetical protein